MAFGYNPWMAGSEAQQRQTWDMSNSSGGSFDDSKGPISPYSGPSFGSQGLQFTGNSMGGSLPGSMFDSRGGGPTIYSPAMGMTGGGGGGGGGDMLSQAFGGFGGGGGGGGSFGGGNMSSTPGYTQGVQSINQPNNQQFLQQLLQSLKTSQTAQQGAANKQYKNLLASVAGTRGQVEGLFGQLGKTGMAQIAEQQKQQTGQTEQDLTSRGLGNTTIRSGALNQVGRNAQLERQQLQEGIAGQKIGAEMGLGQMQGDAILSRQNMPPDIGMYLNLIQSLSQGGGMGGQGNTQIVRK